EIGISTQKLHARGPMLDEARRLVPAPSGFLMACDDRGPRVLADCDMGADREWSSSEKLPGALAREVARSGVSVRSGDDDWLVKLRQLPEGMAYKSRSLVAVPFLEGDTVRAVLYLERPSAQNPFDPGAQRILERLAKVTVTQFSLLARLDRLCRFQGSSILSPAGFDEFLPKLSELEAAGEPFAFLEIIVPGLEAAFSDPESAVALAREIEGYGGESADCIVHITDDTFAFGYTGEAVDRIDSIRSELSDDFARLAERVTGDGRATVSARRIQPDERIAGERDLQRSLWARVFRRRTEFDVGAEISTLTGGGLTLKEAKTALEKRYITAELQKSRGNITRAAESLGVHRPQLSNLIKKYNVRREDFE
ncbi:MAG: helix-turn-helix domain-containing protein, partial [Planctomycetota bacterium]